MIVLLSDSSQRSLRPPRW